jgi:hypothetical protein
MIQVTPQMRVVAAVEPVDFRRGIDGLARLCKDVGRLFEPDPDRASGRTVLAGRVRRNIGIFLPFSAAECVANILARPTAEPLPDARAGKKNGDQRQAKEEAVRNDVTHDPPSCGEENEKARQAHAKTQRRKGRGERRRGAAVRGSFALIFKDFFLGP